MNITGLKLVTGEEVICDLEIKEDHRLLLKNPVQLRLVPPQVAGGQPSMGFVPFPAFSNKPEVVVEPIHVVYTYEPDEMITQNYQATFSGIITPSKQLITG